MRETEKIRSLPGSLAIRMETGLNEEIITNALNELTKGRTVIMIAHRLWTIADADNIVVLESGRASANGTHDELMESIPVR